MTSQTSNPNATSPLPHFHLLCMHKSASDAFANALDHYKIPTSAVRYTIHNTYLADLPPTLTFDLVVSPANSYGLLDGGFDDALSRAFAPQSDYGALTRVAQAHLYREHRGFLPPGSCSIVCIPEAFRGQMRYHDGRGWGCKYLALCPTMRVPESCGWDREVVYECIWSLLCAVEQHNSRITDKGSDGEGVISSILMTPLATGTGGVSDEKWAGQTVLAIKHYLEAGQRPDIWAVRTSIRDVDREIRETHSL